jgi:hypothetical protein
MAQSVELATAASPHFDDLRPCHVSPNDVTLVDVMTSRVSSRHPAREETFDAN